MIAGPLAATMLADQGAEVVKIEQPKGGDRLRALGHRKGTISAIWAGCNRGKRDLVVDLTTPDGRTIAHRLLADADVFIQNFRPGVADRLGLGEAELRAANPGLVYVSVNGFGESGPYVDRKTYDYVVQALVGMAALQTDRYHGRPTLLRNAVIDKATAYAAAQAATAALLARERGAGGQHVRVSMVDVALGFLWPDGMMKHTMLADDVVPGPGMADDYMVFPTADGYLAALPTSDRQFPQLCKALGTSEWLSDPRFATKRERERNDAALRELIESEFSKYTSDDLVLLLDAQDVPSGAVLPLDRVHLDPQIVHNGTLVEHEHPHVGPMREPRPAARFDRTPTDLGRHAPALDEHTDEILAELGYEAAAIADLRSRGVVGPR
jgi:crotonobetainyl-CoA:carnitine CoA-transferase CaiB-like acyl-CoA transferase